MRIIAGTKKGQRIDLPKSKVARPTTDRIRESMMSSVASQLSTFEDAVVLDAFAGSGALGLEALSRGAAQAVFFERSKQVFAFLKQNIGKLGFQKQTNAYAADVFSSDNLFSHMDNRFTLVFLDPPYKIDPQTVIAFLEKLIFADLLEPDALIVYETSNDAKPMFGQHFNEISQKRYGSTKVCMAKYIGNDSIL